MKWLALFFPLFILAIIILADGGYGTSRRWPSASAITLSRSHAIA